MKHRINFRNLTEPYTSGKAFISPAECIDDIMLFAGVPLERIYMIVEDVMRSSCGNLSAELGRALRWRHDMLLNRLN